MTEAEIVVLPLEGKGRRLPAAARDRKMQGRIHSGVSSQGPADTLISDF